MGRNATIRVSRAAFTAMWNNPDVTTDDIAARFGMHRSSVAPTGKRFGLQPRTVGAKPVIAREPFATWWVAGVSGREICAALGLCRNYPGVLARRFELEPRSKYFKAKATIADLQALQLRLAMAASARETKGHMACAEMLDNPRQVLRRAA